MSKTAVKYLKSKITCAIAAQKIKRSCTLHSFRPSLTAADSDIVRCFDAAVHNLVDINTVPCVYDIYNSTGLLQYPFMVRAGKNYKTPWTRDAAINSWNASRFLTPEAARTTLLAVCVKDELGEIIIQPDVQIWDQIVWSIGAWNYYLATGDEEFIKVAYEAIGRALENHREKHFNTEYQLFRGGSFFNDGISGYPLECYTEGLKDSFAPSHSVVEDIMCFSTNCLFCEAYRIYGEISARSGDEEAYSEAKKYHNELKDRINKIFWDDKSGRYRYILFPDGQTDDSQELSGYAFVVLFDICPKEKQREILENLVISEKGAVSVWPPFKGLYSDEKPGRHNNVIWPFLNGILMQAAAECGFYELLGEELDRITALYKDSDFELFEIYSPYTGKAYGGWQTGREWDSCHHQTWSASCYIGAFVHGVFGVKTEKNGVRFAPCVPENLNGSAMSGLNVHGMSLSVKLMGAGSDIERFMLDGEESEPFVPWDNKEHKIEIVMK